MTAPSLLPGDIVTVNGAIYRVDELLPTKPHPIARLVVYRPILEGEGHHFARVDRCKLLLRTLDGGGTGGGP